MNTLRFQLRGELQKIPFDLLEYKPAALKCDCHTKSRGREMKIQTNWGKRNFKIKMRLDFCSAVSSNLGAAEKQLHFNIFVTTVCYG